jgi:4-alpha-glucanotransferase
MELPRASGLLLHPTSLPGDFGIGDLGSGARAFVDFLAETGQRWWQILPIGPTGYGNSPYQSPSSFAGNPLLIDPRGLVERNWLDQRDLAQFPELPADHVDFLAVAEHKTRLLRQAFDRFRGATPDPAYLAFCQANGAWLDEYVFFQAIKDSHGGLPWFEWEPALVTRDPVTCARWRDTVRDGMAFHRFLQFVFELQWQKLHVACRERGVKVIGDLPIFVAHDSADVWARPDLYWLDERGQPLFVAGVPPDYFSATGQLWGNPLYRWEAHAADGFAWWRSRIRSMLSRVDIVRIDHFRGFEAYWEVPAGSATAEKGRWVEAPGRDLFRAIHQELGHLPFIAEDLGVITPPVESLRDEFGLPGMRVLQFGFDPDPGSEKYLPHRYTPHCVAYTGTHDNDTTSGWFHSVQVQGTQNQKDWRDPRAYARRYAGPSGSEIHWDLMRVVFASVANTAIVPMQDVLGLGSDARMNFPGKADGNWDWRFRDESVDRRIVDRLAEMTAVYGRWNGTIPPDSDPRFRPVTP